MERSWFACLIEMLSCFNAMAYCADYLLEKKNILVHLARLKNIYKEIGSVCESEFQIVDFFNLMIFFRFCFLFYFILLSKILLNFKFLHLL